jgi:hypothetical protein
MKRSTVSKDDVTHETFDDVDDAEDSQDRKVSNNKNERNPSNACKYWKCSKCGADCYSKCPWDRSTFTKPKSGSQFGLNSEYSILRRVLSFEEIPVNKHKIGSNDEELKFTLTIPSSVTEGKSNFEVLKEYSKMINDITDQDLKEILCTQHSWIPGPLENKYCQFGHSH